LDQFPQYGGHQVSLFAVELIEDFFNRLAGEKEAKDV
jgi:hypothetical protein